MSTHGERSRLDNIVQSTRHTADLYLAQFANMKARLPNSKRSDVATSVPPVCPIPMERGFPERRSTAVGACSNVGAH